MVAEYGNRIYAAALLLSSNDLDAEELTFKTLDRAVKKIALFDPGRTFFTWLYAILLNLHRMELRKKRLHVMPMGASSDLPEVTCDSFAAVLSRKFGVSPFIIGMVVIGFGTSAPEMAVSALSAASGHSDLSLGNAYGSNFFNTLAVVGVSGLVRPFTCEGGYVLSRDLWMMVALSASIALFGCSFRRRNSGVIGRVKGVVWILSFLAYFALLLIQEHG